MATHRSRLALTVLFTLAALGTGSRPAASQPVQEVKVTIERDRFVPAESASRLAARWSSS